LFIGVILTNFPDHKEDLPFYTHISSKLPLGIGITVLATIISGFSGVYVEKVLKHTPTSIWIRNIQIGVYTIILGFIFGVLLMDGKTVFEKGFFTGYSIWTWIAIIFHSLGGLLITFVVKYADNILKNFASSISIVFTCLISAIWFEFQITLFFCIGK